MKSHLILVYKHGRPSMKEVAKNINECNLFIKSVRFDGLVKYTNGIREKIKTLELNCDESIVIRWGTTFPVITDKGSVVYNKIESTNLSNSKGACRKFLMEKGVPVPKTYLSNEDMSQAVFPLIGRPEHHGQGRNFFICKDINEVNRAKQRNCSYFSEFYNKTKEFRVHCFMGKVLAIMEKHKPEDDKIQWNRALNNQAFSRVREIDWDFDVCKVALQAVEAIGLDFSGVDVMAGAGNGPVIVELNTAPTIISSPYVLNQYVKGFKWLFGSDKRRPKWDCEKFKRVESLRWKDFQLTSDFEIPEDKQLKQNE